MEKNRHIRLRHNIVGRLLNSGLISLNFVRWEGNLVNPLTKPLTRKLVMDTLKMMGLIAQSWVIYNGNPTYVIGDPTK